MSEETDIEILAALGEEVEVAKPKHYTAVEARLIAGFEDILKFYNENKRAPSHGEENDIFERLYAVRLDQLRKNEQALELLESLDTPGLLSKIEKKEIPDTDEALLAELNVEMDEEAATDITKLRHVSPVENRKAAEIVAVREVCPDFEAFKNIFENVKNDLELGLRQTRRSATQDDINIGSFFILGGQIAYVAEKGGEFRATGKNNFDARLRVIFDNGTQSKMLLRSLQRALNADDRGRSISSQSAGPLFSSDQHSGEETGTIYVLRSESDLPEVRPIRGAILKIGVTGGSVKKRISNAKTDATYLLGGVKIVDEYKLHNINRNKLEKLLHHIFADARLNISIPDRFGNAFIPREWFFVTPEAINRAVELIQSGEITSYSYDFKKAQFVKEKQK